MLCGKQGHRHKFKKGASKKWYGCCQRQCIEVRSVDQSAQSEEIFFAVIFQLPGCALLSGFPAIRDHISLLTYVREKENYVKW